KRAGRCAPVPELQTKDCRRTLLAPDLEVVDEPTAAEVVIHALGVPAAFTARAGIERPHRLTGTPRWILSHRPSTQVSVDAHAPKRGADEQGLLIDERIREPVGIRNDENRLAAKEGGRELHELTLLPHGHTGYRENGGRQASRANRREDGIVLERSLEDKED